MLVRVLATNAPFLISSHSDGARPLPSPPSPPFPYFISRLRITFSLVLSSVNRFPLPFLLSFRLSNLDQIAKCGSNFGVAAAVAGRSECAPRTAPRLPCRACGLCAEREGRRRGRSEAPPPSYVLRDHRKFVLLIPPGGLRSLAERPLITLHFDWS